MTIRSKDRLRDRPPAGGNNDPWSSRPHLPPNTTLALAELGQVVTSSLDGQEVIQHILDQVSTLLAAEGVVILLLDGEELVFEGVSGPGAVRLMGTRMPCDAGIVGSVAQSGNPAWRIGSHSSISDVPVYRKVETVSGFRMESLLAVPIKDGDRVMGVLEAAHSRPDAFQPADLTILEVAANWSAIALRNARLHEQAQVAREQQILLEERARLARDLHDAVTQSLYGVVVLAEAWRRQIDAGQLKPNRSHIDELGEMAAQALREVRLMVYELRPAELIEDGLMGALSHRLESVEQRAGIETVLELRGLDNMTSLTSGDDDDSDPASPLRLTEELELGLFRIAQEALNNSLYHARAAEIAVRLHMGDNSLSLEIEDNGRGYDMDDPPAGGYGLRNMRERAERLGGRMIFRSQPGTGTLVRVEGVPTSGRNMIDSGLVRPESNRHV